MFDHFKWLRASYRPSKNKCSTKNHYMKKYRNRVWDLLEIFSALNFTAIPRDQKNETDALAQKGSNFDPTHHWLRRKGIQLIFKLSILENDYFWQVFDNDEDVNAFLAT